MVPWPYLNQSMMSAFKETKMLVDFSRFWIRPLTLLCNDVGQHKPNASTELSVILEVKVLFYKSKSMFTHYSFTTF